MYKVLFLLALVISGCAASPNNTPIYRLREVYDKERSIVKGNEAHYVLVDGGWVEVDRLAYVDVKVGDKVLVRVNIGY